MSALLQPSFDDLSTPLFDVTFCVLDLETTGGSPLNCAITEIGAVKYRGGELIGTFQTLVDPGLPIPPSITVLTGITEAMVVDAPGIGEALPSFLEFIGDSVIVGHNVRFDLSFLRAAGTQLGYEPLSNDSVDTAGLARRLVRDEVRNLRLQTLSAHFRSPVTPIHRALDD
ncbi:MAG TPA: exonuclease domain-containing protein, partial [Acidimicrobiia bacterium]|nr:exonuclease domain-containing protein [Acidimicrobiia bacterium]